MAGSADGLFLNAALSGISGGLINEDGGNSYLNGYVGGIAGGAIQGTCATKGPAGFIGGGALGSAASTVITSELNNIDPDSSNTSQKAIFKSAAKSSVKGAAASTLTYGFNCASDLAVIDGANGLMPQYTRKFGEAMKAFVSWVNDLCAGFLG